MNKLAAARLEAPPTATVALATVVLATVALAYSSRQFLKGPQESCAASYGGQVATSTAETVQLIVPVHTARVETTCLVLLTSEQLLLKGPTAAPTSKCCKPQRLGLATILYHSNAMQHYSTRQQRKTTQPQLRTCVCTDLPWPHQSIPTYWLQCIHLQLQSRSSTPCYTAVIVAKHSLAVQPSSSQ